MDSKPKYLKVRLVSGPQTGHEVKLTDYAGMYPEARPGEGLLVTYDPEQPSRALSQGWVEDPPANLPAYGTSALTLVCLSLTTAVVIRRVRILRSSGGESSASGQPRPVRESRSRQVRRHPRRFLLASEQPCPFS